MEFSDSVDFIQLVDPRNKSKTVTLAIQFEIEKKEFPRFKKLFVTDKWIKTEQWEEIMGRIETFALKRMKLEPNELQTNETGGQFSIDNSMDVTYKVAPKNSSYINFRNFKKEYSLTWILMVKIKHFQHNKSTEVIISSPETRVAEYDPSPTTPKSTAIQTRYKARNKNELDNKTSPEYSPRAMASSYGSISTNIYTPSKINKTPTRQKEQNNMETLFGAYESESEKNMKPSIEISSSQEYTDGLKTRSKKRQMQPVSEQKDNPHSNKKLRSQKKVERDQTTLNRWISAGSDDPARNVSKRSKKNFAREDSVFNRNIKTIHENVDPLIAFGDEKMEKMNNFLEKSKQDEIAKNKRRLELKDLVPWDCHDLTNLELRRNVEDFSTEIGRILSSQSYGMSRYRKYNPVMLTTANILTEKQISFVLKEIENLRDIDERGTKEGILTESVLPEVILHMFQKKYQITKDEAIERFELQEERRNLFTSEDLLL